MKVGIIGSRGIPNRYGGFEQFAEHLAVGFSQKGIDVSVYCSHNHPYQKNSFKGVKLIKCYDPEDKIGISGQFIYDLNCILDSRKRDFDIIYQLGYTSNGIWQGLLPNGTVIITNMDGIEWQRSKYSPIIRSFLKYSEKLAAHRSHHLIADSPVIFKYLKKKYLKPVEYISYGADIPKEIHPKPLVKSGFEENRYYLIIARLQPDNHIEEIIKGVLQSKTDLPLMIVGNHKTKYGEYLKKKYNSRSIKFLEAIFQASVLNSLRKYAKVYFHGHSAGGTNPSLLEAMAAGAKICAHDNLFNKAVLVDNASYFKNENQISTLLDNSTRRDLDWETRINNNIEKIKNTYNWDSIIEEYKLLFQSMQKVF